MQGKMFSFVLGQGQQEASSAPEAAAAPPAATADDLHPHAEATLAEIKPRTIVLANTAEVTAGTGSAGGGSSPPACKAS